MPRCGAARVGLLDEAEVWVLRPGAEELRDADMPRMDAQARSRSVIPPAGAWATSNTPVMREPYRKHTKHPPETIRKPAGESIPGQSETLVGPSRWSMIRRQLMPDHTCQDRVTISQNPRNIILRFVKAIMYPSIAKNPAGTLRKVSLR